MEAFPRKGELSSAEHYHGPISMYIKMDFQYINLLRNTML